MSTPPAPRADLETLKRAVETNDTQTLLDLYAEHAEISIIDRNTPPSRPRSIRGKAAITEYLRDVGGRNLTHRLEGTVAAEDRLAYLEACLYPDGTRVLAATTLDLEGGKIAKQTIVQAWDE